MQETDEFYRPSCLVFDGIYTEHNITKLRDLTPKVTRTTFVCYVKMIIADTGVGISEEDIIRDYEPDQGTHFWTPFLLLPLHIIHHIRKMLRETLNVIKNKQNSSLSTSRSPLFVARTTSLPNTSNWLENYCYCCILARQLMKAKAQRRDDGADRWPIG